MFNILEHLQYMYILLSLELLEVWLYVAFSAYIFSMAVLPCYPGNTEIVWVKVQACGQTIYNWYLT